MDLEKLFHTYADDVFRLAYSWLGNRTDAEDVCQTVFLRLAEGRGAPQPGHEKPYLLTITANLCKNHLRSFWRKNVGELSGDIPFRDPEHRELWDSVQQLPPKYRAVIHLYYYEGYSQKEIGEILHISATAVQTRMMRARGMLKKELIDE